MYSWLSWCCRVARHRRQVIEPEILAEESDDEGKRGREDKASDDEEEEEEELDEEVKRGRMRLRDERWKK